MSRFFGSEKFFRTKAIDYQQKYVQFYFSGQCKIFLVTSCISGLTKLYTCKGNVKFFNTKPLIINKNVYNFIFRRSVKFLFCAQGRGEAKLYTCPVIVQFFSIKALIINANLYNFFEIVTC